ncbi:MAG TPA: hypothetical protein VMA77_04335 [Solirubrobacteraceae bacterium]|nr:hypothetical protein [Solirubrobacteraceae bacterium]
MIRQHHRIKTAVALCAIAAGLAVAGCGGSSAPGKAAGVNTVRAAYVSSSGAGYQMALKVTGSAGGHAINVTGGGEFDQAAHAGQLTMHVRVPALGGQSLQINALILGEDFYLKLPASLAGKLPGGKPWLELSLSELGKSAGVQGLSSLSDNPGANPAHLLRLLRSASTGTVQSLGRRTIDGVSTTGLRATVDLSKVVDTLPASQRQSASSAIASIERLTGLRYLPVTVWVDASSHVRRIVMSETGQVEAQRFSENVQLDFVKYGREPMPSAPPPGDVTDVMSLFGTR